MDQSQIDENKRQSQALQKQLNGKRSDIDRIKRAMKTRVHAIERQYDNQVKSKEDDYNNLSRQVEDLSRKLRI